MCLRIPGRFLSVVFAVLLPAALACASPEIEVRVTGVEGEILNNVQLWLGLSEYVSKGAVESLTGLFGKSSAQQPPDEREIRSLHGRAGDDIRAALQPFGFYSPQITSSLRQEGDRWIASYHIEPGPPTLLESVNVRVQGEGAEDQSVRQALAASELRTGERLDHRRYDALRKSLLKAAFRGGHLDAHYLRSELRVMPDRQRAEAELILETGPRYLFGSVTIEQEILDPDFVSRYVGIHTGEPFDQDRLLELQLALGDSGYFDSVEIDVRRADTEDLQVPVVVHTSPSPYVRYSAGVGFATDTGPRLSLGAAFRRLNSRGHGLRTDLRVSPVEQNIGLQYQVPIRNLLTDRLIYSASLDNAVVADTGDSKRLRLGVSQNISWGKYKRRLYADVQHESFSLGNDIDTVNFIIPGINLGRVHADDVLFPRRGYSWNADLRGAAGVLSDTRFVRIETTLRGVYPLGGKARLIGRTALGAINVDDFSLLPTSERFFAGGDQSVRGYGYQELAPVDSSGEIVGGQYLATVSLEMDYLFFGNYGAAVFVDAGNADNVFPPEPKAAAGAGFRWRTPVGMFRLDVAHPFDSLEKYRIHISIGPEL